SCSQGNVEFRSSPLGGLGSFALTPLKKGEVIFAIPRNLILSSSSPNVLEDPRVSKLAADERITGETLLCAYIVLNRENDEYLASLPSVYNQLRSEELHGTNVGSQLEKDMAEVSSQATIIKEVCGPQHDLTEEKLNHARALYNSRRLPVRFALSAEESTIAVEDTDGSQPTSKKRKLLETRAIYDPTQGCLCPVLDVHNSRPDYPPLEFQITPTMLQVVASYDVEIGDEIYFNYDCQNNDQCLLQFGYLLDAAESNVFTVQVGAQRYELREGSSIPDELLGDGGYGLEQHLQSKQAAQKEASESSNPFVVKYMAAQAKLVEVLLQQVRKQIMEEEEDKG
ncbi:MAG: hypothetical protein SGILL_008570, partial [Bacillariaceae sp.]